MCHARRCAPKARTGWAPRPITGEQLELHPGGRDSKGGLPPSSAHQLARSVQAQLGLRNRRSPRPAESLAVCLSAPCPNLDCPRPPDIDLDVLKSSHRDVADVHRLLGRALLLDCRVLCQVALEEEPEEEGGDHGRPRSKKPPMLPEAAKNA